MSERVCGMWECEDDDDDDVDDAATAVRDTVMDVVVCVSASTLRLRFNTRVHKYT